MKHLVAYIEKNVKPVKFKNVINREERITSHAGLYGSLDYYQIFGAGIVFSEFDKTGGWLEVLESNCLGLNEFKAYFSDDIEIYKINDFVFSMLCSNR